MIKDLDLFRIVILGDKTLLEKRIVELHNINVLDDDGNNLLQKALSYGRIEIALKLIEGGINVNNQNKEGKTALHYAADPESFEIAKAILKFGGDLSIQDKYGNTPLWYATFHSRGVYDVVALFVEYDGNPLQKNRNNKSPLDFAKQIDDKTLTDLLS